MFHYLKICSRYQNTRTWYLGQNYGDPASNTAFSAGKPWKTIVRNQADTEDFETDDAGRRVKTVSPDTGTTLYTYNDAGNRSTLNANDGQTIQYNYDNQYRLTGISYEDTDRDITYTYDQETVSGSATNGKGRLTTITDPSGTTVFRYDTQGLTSATEKTAGAVIFTTSYSHDDGGLPGTITYPSGRIVTYARDASGNITSVSTTFDGTTQTLADNITYAPFGPVKSMDFSNGKTETRSFDLQYRTGSIATPDITDLSYTYNTAGYISGVTSAISDPASFKPAVSQEDQATYTLETGTNRLSTIAGSTTTTSFTHDQNGNITAKGSTTFEYFQDNRLSTVKEDGTVIAEYEYNCFGQRTMKTMDGASTLFHYDLNGNLICESGTDGTIQKEYIYLGNLPLVMIIHGTDGVATYFYHTDHLGTPAVLTDDAGQIVWKANYSPFGTINISTAVVENNLRFPGQYYDAETGLHYNWHRYYDPATGRYLTPDPIGLAGGINPFVYAESNPINNIDPWGLQTIADKQFYNPLNAGGGYGGAAVGTAITATALLKTINKWLNESTENHDSDPCSNEDSLDDYPANPDEWIPPEGWEETNAGEATGGKHRQWRGPDGQLRRWDREGREGGKERGPHWHDPRYPGRHIPPNR